MRIPIFIVCVYLVLERSHESNSQNLPKPLDFLSFLLNTTEAGLLDLVKNFDFLGVDGEEVKFYLYAPVKNDSHRSIQKYEFTLVEPEEIDLTKPTKIYTHGWVSTIKDDYIKQLAEIYVRRGPFNFIAVYWDKIANKNYLEAASSCKGVGKHVAYLLLRAAEGRTSFLRNVHLIGHSLGAQISGFVGKEVNSRDTSYRVTRITALDAAAPLFEFPILMPPTHRIAADDAIYVESVHTNAGFLGFLSPVGQVDFYINNGGPVQPGCLNSSIIDTIACSHMRAHDFYGQSVKDYIDTNGFSRSWLAVNCSNSVRYLTGMCDNNAKAILGEESARNRNGSYYLITKAGYEVLDNLQKQISHIVEGFPSRNPNFKGFPPNNPDIQSFPSNNPNAQVFPSNNPNVQGFPLNNGNVQDAPLNNANVQSFPSNNPNAQGFPSNNPYYQGYPLNNAHVQDAPLNNANVQGFPSNNPNVQSFPLNNGYFQNVPSNNPNLQSFPSNNPNVQNVPSSNQNGYQNNPNNQGISGFPFVPFPFQGNIFPNNKFLF